MIKENYSIEVSTQAERIEARGLFESLKVGNYEIAVSVKTTSKPNITLPELRELVHTKEYLNDKYELVVTNMPKSGWMLVPKGATHFNYGSFYKQESDSLWFHGGGKWINSGLDHIKNATGIKWQRNPKQETTMNTEKKGRFLHQEWYEAFGRGEDVEIEYPEDSGYREINLSIALNLFDNTAYKFRLKPKTIQIGPHTIVKPIDVKPELETKVFISDLTHENKYFSTRWTDSMMDNLFFSNRLMHLTDKDAINQTNATLELFKNP